MTASPGNQATPPGTGTERNDSDEGSSPLFAMLISLAFAALAAFAAIRQRRGIAR